MLDFIRRHWIAYVVALIVAIALGAGAAYYVGVKASTPSEVRIERISAEKENATFLDSLDSGSGQSSAVSQGSNQ